MTAFERANQLENVADTIPSPGDIGHGLDKLCTYWPIIVIALKLAKIFTGSKGDAKLDQVITWGNSVCGNGGNND